MKTLRFLPLLLALLAFGLSNCGQDAEKSTDQNNVTDTAPPSSDNDFEPPTSPGDVMAQTKKAIKDLQGENADITPVNFRELKALLPDELLDLPRTKHSGESAGIMGMKFSTAEAKYGRASKKLTVKIMDIAGIGAAALSMASWSTMEIDKESDEGYERTSDWGDFKTIESCRTRDNFCSLKLYSEEGIVAEIEGYNIPVSDLKQVAREVKVSSVPGMRE